jgi:cobalt/nickel transport protein
MKLVLSIALFFPLLLWGHFQVILPSKATVESQEDKKIELTYEFTHPFEQALMNMQKPLEAGVFYEGKKQDMLSTFKEEKKEGMSFWKGSYVFKAPSTYQFYVIPKPYFEPAEGKFIQHQTKVIVDAFESSEGWDEPVGLKAEIIPFTRPYGLYSGNIFSAKVLYKGKPAKNVEVEVELYNDKHHFKAPTNSHVTQVVKTNENGVFHFVMPKSGWWGFAALIDDDVKISKDKKEYPVELGAVLWVHCEDMK